METPAPLRERARAFAVSWGRWLTQVMRRSCSRAGMGSTFAPSSSQNDRMAVVTSEGAPSGVIHTLAPEYKASLEAWKPRPAPPAMGWLPTYEALRSREATVSATGTFRLATSVIRVSGPRNSR